VGSGGLDSDKHPSVLYVGGGGRAGTARRFAGEPGGRKMKTKKKKRHIPHVKREGKGAEKA